MKQYRRASSVERLQAISRFESLRKILTSGEYAEHLDRPLAYWALPADRRLPLAFLGRTLRDLLSTPFSQLSLTPGIGQKKIDSFVKLLARAANTDPSDLPWEIVPAPEHRPKADCDAASPGGNGFDPGCVSEVVWSQWQASVVKHGLGDEPLGRLAPSLKHMTRVIWDSPLRAYTDCTLGGMRALKTHGEKRVHAILEVFHSVHVLVTNMGRRDHLTVRIVPRLIDGTEQWIGRALQRPGVPGREEIFAEFVSPLLEQIRSDTAEQIVSLAENRLGIRGPITSVRQVARSMGLTRARVYQLLNEINDVMMVRWPTGRHQVYELRAKLLAESAQMEHPPDLEQFSAAVELFYPGSRRGAAGPLEPVRASEQAAGQSVETG
jgi:hypothetical protein